MSAYPQPATKPSSYLPVAIVEPLDSVIARMSAGKIEIMLRRLDLLDQ
jgi:hypothetical protein